jgi:arsenate reductase-like glutaredoxin family protein
LKELETKQTEFENMDIVDIVRGMSIPLDDLADILQSLKSGVLPDLSTSGQLDPKLSASKNNKNNTDTDIISENNEQDKEEDSE